MSLQLPRLPTSYTPSEFQYWWQQVAEAIEAQEAAQDEAIADIQATQRRDSISASFTVPTMIASAADAGADVTITIIAHTRRYGDETGVSVNGGAIPGQPYSTDVAVYYDQPSRAGGAVAYVATTDLKIAQNNYVAGRHYVATLTTPAALGAPTSGGSPPPGSGYSGTGGVGTFIP